MILYHATFRTNLPSIKKTGLDGSHKKNWDISNDGDICLCTDYDEAISYCETAEDVPDYKYNSGIILLAVNIINKAAIKRDINIKDTNTCFTFNGKKIPKEKLLVCNSQGKIIGKLLEVKRVPRVD